MITINVGVATGDNGLLAPYPYMLVFTRLDDSGTVEDVQRVVTSFVAPKPELQNTAEGLDMHDSMLQVMIEKAKHMAKLINGEYNSKIIQFDVMAEAKAALNGLRAVNKHLDGILNAAH